MYRILCFLSITVVLLVGCQVNNGSFSPKQALEQLHQDENYAEAIEIYEDIYVNDTRVISVYKGIINNVEDVFVANIEKSNGIWEVTHAQNIGLPSVDNLNRNSSTEKFQAGYLGNNSVVNEEFKVVEMNNEEFNIWIKVF